MHYSLETLRHLPVISSKSTKGFCLLLKTSIDGFNSFARVEFDGEWMTGQACPSLLLEFLEGSIEEGLEDQLRRPLQVTHVVSRREDVSDYWRFEDQDVAVLV